MSAKMGVFRGVFVLAAVLAGAAMAGEALAEGRAVVYNFDGKVSIVRNRKTLPIDLDMKLREGDRIRTEEDGFVDTTLNGIVGFRVMASSEATLVNTNEGNMVVKGLSGSFMVNMKALSTGSTFRLVVPNVTALVRDTKPGTQFYVAIKPAADGGPPSTLVSAEKNTIYAVTDTSNVTVSLLESTSLDVPPGNSIPPIRNQSDAEDAIASKALSIYVSDD